MPARHVTKDPWKGARTNTQRANRAAKALAAYRRAEKETTPDEADMRDLLCDLMHLAPKLNLDFRTEVRYAEDNFAAEVAEDPA